MNQVKFCMALILYFSYFMTRAIETEEAVVETAWASSRGQAL